MRWIEQGELTYKCFVWTSRSRPGVVPVETGMVPVSMLSARSSQKSLSRLPSDGGIDPLKRFELRDLQVIPVKSFRNDATGINWTSNHEQ
jgi:hypothetical protein